MVHGGPHYSLSAETVCGLEWYRTASELAPPRSKEMKFNLASDHVLRQGREVAARTSSASRISAM